MALFSELVEMYRSVWGDAVAVDEENHILSVRYRHEEDEWIFVGTIEEDGPILTLFSRAPENCPIARRAAMCELLIRLNFGMTHGGFDMDLDDGEIRFRTGVDLAGYELSPSMVQALTNYNLASMATYLPALRAVIDGGAPLDAMALVGLA